MGAFYPSVVFNFGIRFDEAFTGFSLPEPVTPAGAAKKPLIFGPPEPLVFSQATPENPDGLSHILRRVPKSATVELPGYRQAGKFSATFAFQDIPIDPRLLRAGIATIFIGAVPEGDFGEGMESTVVVNGVKVRKSILRPTSAANVQSLQQLQTSDDTLVMWGYIDEISMEHTERGSEFHVEGRDLRGVFLDPPTIDPETIKNLDLTKPIDDVVRDIIAKHPLAGNFANIVKINPDDWTRTILGPLGPVTGVFPLPSPFSKDGRTSISFGAKQSKRSGPVPQGNASSVSYWDLITKYCYLVGAIPYFSGRNLLIRPSRSIFDHQKLDGIDPRRPTPFTGGKPRDVTSGSPPTKEPIRIRQLVFGRDVASMKFSRKYTSQRRPIVRCVSIDTGSTGRGMQKVVEAVWPDDKIVSTKAGKRGKAVAVTADGKLVMEQILNIPVPGIKDANVLQQVARDIYEEIGRGEMGGAISTKNLASFGGSNSDPDLLRLRPGDPVQVLVDTRALEDRSPLISEFTENSRASERELEERIFKKVGDRNLARVIVATARGGVPELQNFYRVANVKFGWSGQGISIDFDFQNYVEITGIAPSAGENVAKPKSKAVRTPQEPPVPSPGVPVPPQ